MQFTASRSISKSSSSSMSAKPLLDVSCSAGSSTTKAMVAGLSCSIVSLQLHIYVLKFFGGGAVGR